MNDVKFPDAYASKQYWLECLKPPAMAGRLDNIPAKKPVTKKDHDVARKQNYELSRRSYGVPDLSHINWSK